MDDQKNINEKNDLQEGNQLQENKGIPGFIILSLPALIILAFINISIALLVFTVIVVLLLTSYGLRTNPNEDAGKTIKRGGKTIVYGSTFIIGALILMLIFIMFKLGN